MKVNEGYISNEFVVLGDETTNTLFSVAMIGFIAHIGDAPRRPRCDKLSPQTRTNNFFLEFACSRKYARCCSQTCMMWGFGRVAGSNLGGEGSEVEIRPWSSMGENCD